jgi:hypothetical protein
MSTPLAQAGAAQQAGGYTHSHTERLARYLALESMGPGELRRFAESLPRSLAYRDAGGKTVRARELLLANGSAANSPLIPVEVLGTVLEGARKRTCMREVLPTIQMKTTKVILPVGTGGVSAPVVPPGAEIPIETAEYSHYELEAVKYGLRPMITQEMIDDLLFDVIAQEIQFAGAKLETTLNRLALEDLIARGNDAATALKLKSAADPYSLHAIAEATAQIRGKGFDPTKLVLTPVGWSRVMTELTTSRNQLQDESMRSGTLGKIMGLDTHICSVDAKDWSDKYVGILLDADRAGRIGIRKDITVANFTDEIRQMRGLTVTASWAVSGPKEKGKWPAITLLKNA